ncbi:MAG: hypothetical protein KBD12_00145 [Candidatus Pacebacteria bacterium]|nr:hypothetical protein [Candidatus Paceibacterota bacterium]
MSSFARELTREKKVKKGVSRKKRETPRKPKKQDVLIPKKVTEKKIRKAA